MASRYEKLIEKVFFDHYQEGMTEFDFNKDEFEKAGPVLDIKLPKNIPDTIYSFRYRNPLPSSVLETQPEGLEWAIFGTGKGTYKFRLSKINRITPNENLLTIKIPDSTPEIVAEHALNDEQALLAKVRYNRLIDIFLSITTYSLQNHLRTSVKGMGQIEIDEIYVGLDQGGRQFIVPVQAKGGKDQHGVVQTQQDIVFCQAKYPELITRAVSAQFINDNLIAMFELTLQDEEIKVVNEKHYQLVQAKQISDNDLSQYKSITV